MKKRFKASTVLVFLLTLAFYVAAAKTGTGGHGFGHGFFSGG